MENWKQTKGLRGADPSSTVTGEREASPSQKVVVRANGEMMHMASSSKVVSDEGYGVGVEMRRESDGGCAFPVVFFGDRMVGGILQSSLHTIFLRI